ncbi:aldo/keto reductase [Streptomyces platensis]|uniref:aldo/keto reductase n=1 Tax=Streptomyces platensis TaxID=58346 RepID=UPI002E14335C|nr:aldo/keto reductase [Streptomyces platensis]WSI60062.1 aldo/keto reductase [Streptomyces platensis]
MTASLALGTYRLREVATAVRRAAACPSTAWVDTAPNYLAGRAHRLLAPVLTDHPGMQVSTKVGFPAPGAAAAVAAGVLPPEAAERGHSLAAGYVRWQVERNRAALGRACLDTVFLHNPERTDDPAVLPIVLREAFAVLEEAAVAGHLSTYGIATWSGFTEGLLTVGEAGPPGHRSCRLARPPTACCAAASQPDRDRRACAGPRRPRADR